VTVRAALVLVVAAVGCGDNLYRDEPYFAWDGVRVVGAYSLDGLAPDDPRVLREVDYARDAKLVTLFYGHNPPTGTSFEMVDALLARAQADGIPALTFAELAAGGGRRGAICLSFDDTEVDAWYALRPVLAQHAAHVSFFVTEYATFSADARAKLHTLYDDGSSIEAHGVNHQHAKAYVAAHGIDAYITDEVQPSFDILRADGFEPVAFAYPYGETDQAIDRALAQRYDLIRAISGHPK
jgi:peptidoglycan/xylan/chitin deacetylase (PgdA/CDA1 family)